ncbi:MAG: AMP-binding protein [Planctomycetota bacterium]
MRRLIVSFLMFLLRWMLWVRYRIRVEGMENIPRGLTRTLVLPNHPGYIDPAIVYSRFWGKLTPRPMVFGPTFRNPFLFWLKPLLDPVLIPELDSHSQKARELAKGAIGESIKALQAGSNMIIYPSGRLYRQGHEYLGSTRGISDILQAVPDAQIILVRTRGIWGSQFSFAQTGELPNLTKCLIKGILTAFANLLLFTPRRRVTLQVEMLDRAKLPGLEKERLNPFLEEWYNRPGSEEPTWVPYHFLFGARSFNWPKLGSRLEVNPKDIKPETKDAVREMIASALNQDDLDASELRPERTLEDLGLDSLDRMELSLQIEQRFQFHGETVPTTVLETWALAQGLMEGATPEPPPPAWFRKPDHYSDPTTTKPLLAPTLGEAFVARALSQKKDVAVADSLAGTVTYERLLVGALLMASRFRKIAAPNVGLMLPASVASDIAFFGIHLAGKLPVLLNWTTGPANLAHAATSTGLTHVVTSRKFLDRSGVTVDGPEMILLEDLRQEFSGLEKIRTLLRVKLLGGGIRASVPKPAATSPAVVLFTSGSEKAPKAVPLTHDNIVSNLTSAVTAFGVHRGDSALGFLPAFHSFGLTVMTLMPILCGARVVHHPDPTDAATLARKIATWRPTIMCSTPTFLGFILDRASADDVSSLRLCVVGAEKCPDRLFEQYAGLTGNADLLEGYGITECSPGVSANTPGQSRRGTLGKPLPGVEVIIVDPDTHEPVGDGERGMLLVHGPNVFPGYMAYEGASPFVQHAGKDWYRTGDLGRFDEDGYLHFLGRLKRFVKAGGEMISLPALEEPLAAKYPPDENGPRVAVEGLESESGTQIVLFSAVEELSLRDANAILAEHGFRGVMRLHDLRRVDTIPVLGTGKTDYKQLRALIEDAVAVGAK